jgi:GDPmannose 4,6-dehydratase
MVKLYVRNVMVFIGEKMEKIKSLILGVGGQDGSYLAEILLSKNQDVYGIVRRSSLSNTSRIDHIFDPEKRDKIFYGDIEEGIFSILLKIKPDYVYNLAAQSHV